MTRIGLNFYVKVFRFEFQSEGKWSFFLLLFRLWREMASNVNSGALAIPSRESGALAIPGRDGEYFEKTSVSVGGSIYGTTPGGASSLVWGVGGSLIWCAVQEAR